MERYKHLNTYLKQKFGERTLKVCVDGGFTCPNRDGSKSTTGCLFCSARGSGDHLLHKKSITSQIAEQIEYKIERAEKFIVYFQSFSNTYAPIDVLEKKYTEAMHASTKVVGLDIATRPDCISDDIIHLLSKINPKTPVSVELGLQTANESTGKFINRQYTNSDFKNAVYLLHEANIEIVAHIMVGLPEETPQDLKNTIDFLNRLPISGVKIHSTYILKNTGLEKLYASGTYSPLSQEDYINSLIFAITHLRPDIIIHRLTGDPPKNLLLAPEWALHKKPILNGIEKILKEQNLYQGIYYKK